MNNSLDFETCIANIDKKATAILVDMRSRHQSRMEQLYKTTLPFEKMYFENVLACMAEGASKGTGCSYELYVANISSMVDGYISELSEPVAKEFLALAKEKYDYATPEEIQMCQEELKDEGYCSHGIELGCCPAGCGSY